MAARHSTCSEEVQGRAPRPLNQPQRTHPLPHAPFHPSLSPSSLLFSFPASRPPQIDGDTGSVTLKGDTEEACAQAEALLKGLVSDPEVGTVYRGCRVTSVMPFGAFVEVRRGWGGAGAEGMSG
jgi:hypothetical protein